MSAEVVVVVEDQNARVFAGRLAVEVRRGQTADAAADDDQVVSLAGILGLAGRVPECAVAQAVSRIERSGMAAAKSGERRRIVVGRLFGTAIDRPRETGAKASGPRRLSPPRR